MSRYCSLALAALVSLPGGESLLLPAPAPHRAAAAAPLAARRVSMAYNPQPSKAKPRKAKSKEPKQKVKGPPSAAAQLQLVPEQTFYEAAPSITETIIPGLSVLTVVGIIPFGASLARQVQSRSAVAATTLATAALAAATIATAALAAAARRRPPPPSPPPSAHPPHPPPTPLVPRRAAPRRRGRGTRSRTRGSRSSLDSRARRWCRRRCARGLVGSLGHVRDMSETCPQVTWREVVDVKWLRRFGGAAGDLVLTLQDGAKVEITRDRPRLDKIKLKDGRALSPATQLTLTRRLGSYYPVLAS